MKKKYEQLLKELIIPKGATEMNLDVFSSKNHSASSIINAAETLPFLSDMRLIIVRGSELFKTGRKDDSEMLSKYITDIPSTSCLLFIEDNIDKRNKLYKQVEKKGRVIEFKKQHEKELVTWIRMSIKEMGLDIDSATAVYLLRCVSNNMEAVNMEMMKLSAYKAQSEYRSISIADIDSVCTKSLQAKIFDLVGAIGNKKTETALVIYNNLLQLKESPIMILAMITRQFRIILQCSSLRIEGFNSLDISKQIGQPVFVVKEALQEAANFNISDLKSAMSDSLETDINIKTGKLRPELAVEMLIVKLLQNY